MRTRSRLFLFVLGAMFLVLPGSGAHSQTEMRKGMLEIGPLFYAEAIAYAADVPNKARIDVYVQVPHEEIRFVKENDRYIGRYEINVSLTTAPQQLVHEQTWTVDVPVAEFTQTTQNRLNSLTHRTIDVDPGIYQMTIQLRDLETRKASQIKRSLLVTDFAKDSVSLSDIMLVNRLSTDGEKRTIVPNISGSINSSAAGFFVFFELYNKPLLDSATITWKIFDSKKNEVASHTIRQDLIDHKTQLFLKVDSTGLQLGTYFLNVEATAGEGANGKSPEFKASTSRTFNIRATDLPAGVVDLDKAIEQMAYIAKPSEIEYCQEAKTIEEKRQRFLEFWSKRDPDGSTRRNELMEEYYARVAYSNQNFGHYIEGWRTDMGMVFIRFGTPENIERHPFEYDSKPYEIWYYYQLNRQFIFVDETGFGDYRLRYPTTDLWGRMR